MSILIVILIIYVAISLSFYFLQHLFFFRPEILPQALDQTEGRCELPFLYRELFRPRDHHRSGGKEEAGPAGRRIGGQHVIAAAAWREMSHDE